MDEVQNAPFKAIPQTLRYNELERPDGQIRILTLDNDAGQQQISGKLKIVNLDDHPRYNAISYVWGDLDDLRQILVDGELFNVTKNQQECLCTLHSQGLRNCWMDGICINQHNLSERSIQVANMKRIFQMSGEVHIWAGPDLDYFVMLKTNDQAKKRFMTDMWEREAKYFLEYDWNDIFKEMPVVQKKPSDDADELGHKDLHDELLQMINLMITGTPFRQLPFYYTSPTGKPLPRRPWSLALYLLSEYCASTWWERLWVVQEVLFSEKDPRIHLGFVSFPLKAILLACQYFYHQEYYLNESDRFSNPRTTLLLRRKIFSGFDLKRNPAHFQQATYIMRLRGLFQRDKVTGLPPEDVFRLALEYKASDKRDFIYGMIGLLEDRFKPIFRPDYHDEDVSSLFVKASRYVVQSSDGDLQMNLSRGAIEASLKTGHFEHVNANEPTWALEWGCHMIGQLWRPRCECKASGDTKHATSANDLSPRHLTVSGSIIGVVTELGIRGSDKWLSRGWNGNSEVDIINDWRVLAGLSTEGQGSPQSPLQDEGSSEDRFWRVLTDRQSADTSTASSYRSSSWQPPSIGRDASRLREWGPNLRFKWQILKEGLTQEHADRAQLTLTGLEEAIEVTMHCHTHHKVLFRFDPSADTQGVFTDNGPYIGTGRRTTQAGDTLAILKGCPWPVVLRVTQDGRWKFVGPAHVDEVMDGQWVTSDTRWESFTLV